jgi:hypothetical protein
LGDAALAEVSCSVLLWNAISVEQLSRGSGACLIPPAADDLCEVLVVFLHVSLLSPSPLLVQIYTLHNFYYRPDQTSPLLNNKDRSLVHIQGFI